MKATPPHTYNSDGVCLQQSLFDYRALEQADVAKLHNVYTVLEAMCQCIHDTSQNESPNLVSDK